MLPQAAWRLDDRAGDRRRTRCGSRSSGSTSTRRASGSCATKHGGDGDAVRAEVLEIIATRGKMQNPVTGSGGMLIGIVDEVGPGLAARAQAGRPGRHAGLADPDPAGDHRRAGRLGRPQRAGAVPPGTRSCSPARSPRCCPTTSTRELALAVLDVCGAPALTDRVVRRLRGRRRRPSRVIGGAGKSGRCRWPPPGAPAPPVPSGSSRRGRARPRCAAAGLADDGRARRRPRPGRAGRRGRPRRWAARPTSPWSASTCPAASTARSWPPPTAAR